jgi:hypothetical protein
MSCQNCYEVEIPECPSSILVKCGLEASRNYFVTIIDKFGERYNQQCQSDANGSILLSVAALPVGALNRHAGTFTVEARKVLANCEPELMQFCCDGTIVTYSCIKMSFFQSTLGSLQTDIGCICNDPVTPTPPGPGTDESQEFPFTNVTTVTCVHNLNRFADVTVYNSAGNEIEAQVEQDPNNLNQVIVTFNTAQTGTVLID